MRLPARPPTRRLTALGWSAFATMPGTAPATPSFSAFAAPQPSSAAASAPSAPASAIPTVSNPTPSSAIVQAQSSPQSAYSYQTLAQGQAVPQGPSSNAYADPGSYAYEAPPDSSGGGGGGGGNAGWGNITEADWLILAAAVLVIAIASRQ